MFYSNEKFSVFIDSWSLNQASRSIELQIDFKRLRDELVKRGRLQALNYYTVVDEREEDNPLIPLLQWLSYNGYRVHRKLVRGFTNDDGRRVVRGSLDVEIALDMMASAQNVDHIVLFSGNRDYVYAVESVQRLGCRVTLCSTRQAESHICSDELRRAVDSFIELEDLADSIEKLT